MSCKSAIYAVNTTTTAGIASGSTLPLGTTARRFGCNCQLSGNGILLSGQGYYEVNANFTLVASAADIITVQLYKDGVAVSGAKASASAGAAGTVVIPVNALVRNQCCNASASLTFVVTAEAAGTTVTVENSAVVVEKI